MSAALRLTCEACGAAVTAEAGQRTATCSFCASPSVVLRPEDPSRPDPVFALGFAIPREQVESSVRAWLKRRTFFARSGVRAARVEDVRGVYVPTYLYGALARSIFEAEIGEVYQVRRGKNGTRQEIEWYPLQGARAAYVSDLLVSASHGIDNQDLEKLEPFDLRDLRRYAPAMVSGWIAEDATRPHAECLALARTEVEARVAREIGGFLPGDRQRHLRHSTRLEREELDLMLVPIWVLAIRYDVAQPPFRLLVNGQTGAIVGKVPLSIVKIVLAVLGALAVVGLVGLLGHV